MQSQKARTRCPEKKSARHTGPTACASCGSAANAGTCVSDWQRGGRESRIRSRLSPDEAGSTPTTSDLIMILEEIFLNAAALPVSLVYSGRFQPRTRRAFFRPHRKTHRYV